MLLVTKAFDLKVAETAKRPNFSRTRPLNVEEIPKPRLAMIRRDKARKAAVIKFGIENLLKTILDIDF